MSAHRYAFAVLGSALLACGATSTSTSSRREVPPANTERDAAAAACPTSGVAVQVLGSGGPILDDDRASSGYLVRVDGEPRLLVDAGGGVALRMAQAEVRPEALGGILLTHLHVDHTADLIALLKAASFAERTTPMPLLGPSAGNGFPGTESFLAALLGESGAWRYLGGFLRDDGQPFQLQADEVDVTGDGRTLEVAGLGVDAVGVPHGPVPALGYVVHAGDVRVAFTGDQRLDDPRFLAIARGADLLIAHHAIPEGAQGMANDLHATPSAIGRFAAEADVGRVVLSHHMQRALARKDEGLAAIRAHYEGPLAMASDLDCYAVPSDR